MMVVLAYLLIAAGFAIPTLAEGNRRNLGWGVHRFAGLAMSLAWPAIAGMIIMAGSRKHSAR
jgi:hypothetical protein